MKGKREGGKRGREGRKRASKRPVMQEEELPSLPEGLVHSIPFLRPVQLHLCDPFPGLADCQGFILIP